MKKIMNVWAKISSIVIIFWMIQLIYLASKIIISAGSISSWPTPILTPVLWVLVILSSIGSMIIFYGPLFYFAWVKNPESNQVKLWAKGLTIIFPVFFVFGLISPWGLGLSDISFLIPVFLAIVPIYYYAWK